MPSNRAKGSYNKLKTRKWYEQDGYTVYDLELKKSVWVKSRIIYTNCDTAGADLLAMRAAIADDPGEIIFIQCKSNSSDISKATREFSRHPFPTFVKRHVVLWELRAREPKVIEL